MQAEARRDARESELRAQETRIAVSITRRGRVVRVETVDPPAPR